MMYITGNYSAVILSIAKNLANAVQRPFASLRVTRTPTFFAMAEWLPSRGNNAEAGISPNVLRIFWMYADCFGLSAGKR